MESHINKKHCFYIASSLVLLAICFSPYHSFGQAPKLLLKFVEKQQQIESGYVTLQKTYIYDDNTPDIHTEEAFFISTPKNLAYLSYHQREYQKFSFYTIHCKLAYTIAMYFTDKNSDNYRKYRYFDSIRNAKDHIGFNNAVSFSTDYSYSLEIWKKCSFQRIPPKINKRNIRYKILYPDDDIDSNSSGEWEFERKTFNLVQKEYSGIYFNIEKYYQKIDILEQRTYDYIHPGILDTINFKYEEVKKGYEQQCAVEQAKKDSIFRDSIVSLVARNAGAWTQEAKKEKDTVFFMPDWKYPSLSGDTIYSDSIQSRFLFIDLWYISCHPCRLAMRELASIDTLYDESLLKIVSINVFDTDTAKMNRVVKNLNLQSDVACAYSNESIFNLSKKMGESRNGYPQLYLIDMKTRQVIWYSYGWGEGFTKEIGEIIKNKYNKTN